MRRIVLALILLVGCSGGSDPSAPTTPDKPPGDPLAEPAPSTPVSSDPEVTDGQLVVTLEDGQLVAGGVGMGLNGIVRK